MMFAFCSISVFWAFFFPFLHTVLFSSFLQSDNYSSLDELEEELEQMEGADALLAQEADDELEHMMQQGSHSALEGAKLSHLTPQETKERMNEILEVLRDFKHRKEPNKSRSDYVQALVGYCVDYYGYLEELIELFFTMFSPDEVVEFLEANEHPRPLIIRTNTLKCRRKDLIRKLSKRGVSLEPLADWSKVLFVVFAQLVIFCVFLSFCFYRLRSRLYGPRFP